MGANADEARDTMTNAALDAGAEAKKASDDVNALLKVQRADEEGKTIFARLSSKGQKMQG